jgi:predicted outer membrane lipoprotein
MREARSRTEVVVLSEEQKSLIRAEEAFREAVRAELAAEKGGRSRWQRLVDFLNMPIGGWVLGTVLVAAFSFLWTQAYERLHATERELAERRANAQKDVELVTRLLPALANVGTPENPLALQVVGHLQATGGIDEKLAGALQVVVRESLDESLRRKAGATDDQRRMAYQASAEAAVAALDARQRAVRLEQPVSPAPPPGGQPQTVPRPEPSPPAPAAPSALPQRIYVHIADESQRPQAQALQAYLREQKFLMPGIENVGRARAPAIADVRYFNDADAATARRVLDEMRKLGVKVNPTPKKLPLQAPEGQVEIWLPRPGALPSS